MNHTPKTARREQKKLTAPKFATLKPIKIATPEHYPLFGFYEYNRKPDHIDKIANSMRIADYSMDSAVLVYMVSEILYMIIDGQNRALARMQLGEDIYFFISSYDNPEEEMIVLNTNQTNWDLFAYQGHYCYFKRKPYLTLQGLVDSSSLRLNEIVHSCLSLTLTEFAKGNLEMTKIRINVINTVNACFETMQECCSISTVSRRSRVVRALRSVIAKQDFCLNKFKHQFKEKGLRMNPIISQEQGEEEILRIVAMV